MRLHPKDWSLATKWSLMLTALAVGPVLLVVSYSSKANADKYLEQMITAQQNSASDGAASLDDALGERIRQAQFLATLPSVRDFGATAAGARSAAQVAAGSDLRALQSAYPYMVSLDLLDGQGVVIFSTAGHTGVVKDPDLFKATAQGQVYVAGPQAQAERPEPVLVIAAPVGKNGQAVVRTESSPKFLLQRVAKDNDRQGSGALGLLLDQNGHVLARSDGAAPGDAAALEPGGRLTLGAGPAYVGSSSTLNTLPWRYVVAVPEAQFTDAVKEQRTRAFLLALGVSAIIGAVARLLALGFTKPLSKMATATRALAAGDLTLDVPPGNRQDEVGQLQNAFSEAYSQLRRLAARMRLSSIMLSEAADHLHGMATESPQVGAPIAQASEKLSVVAKDLERQVAHFKV